MATNRAEAEAAPDPQERRAFRTAALTAVVGNATALGLGFVYLRNWNAFGATLLATGITAFTIVWVDPPVHPVWLIVVGVIALGTSVAAWRHVRAMAFEAETAAYLEARRHDRGSPLEIAETSDLSEKPDPFPGRIWLPAFLTVLAAYAGAYAWIVTDADRIHQDQTQAHASADCETAVASTEALNWAHHTFTRGRYADVLHQADTCELYLTAQSHLSVNPEPTDWDIERAIDYLEFYLGQPQPLLAEQVDRQRDQLKVELLLTFLVDYRWVDQSLPQLIGDIQDHVTEEPDSAAAEEALAGVEAVTAEWREEVGGDEPDCEISNLVEHLVGSNAVYTPNERAELSGPIADPLLEAAEAIRPDAAFDCVRWRMARSETELEWPEQNRNGAIELLRMLAEEYPDFDRSAEVEDMLRELEE